MTALGRVLVVGALHLDVIVSAPRLPRRDETLMGDAVRFDLGGKAGNQALAAARLGAPVSLAARLGGDGFGAQLLARLSDAATGLDLSLLQQEDGASGMSVALLEPGGEYGAVVVSGANRRLDAALIAPPADTAIVCLQNEVPDAVNLAVARAARTRGASVLLNAAPARAMDAALLTATDLLVVNRVEAEDLTGSADPVPAASTLARRGPGAVIVTLGGDGLVWAEAGAAPAAPTALPALPVPMISAHGAGDAFVGALAARLAAGDPLTAALGFAQAAAALHVSMPVADRAGIDAAAVRARMRQPQ